MYYLTYGFLYLFSLLPLRVLYILSDGLYALVYYVIGYRKEVVMQNLAIAFPHKTEDERIRIAKNFYHKFIDSLLEAVKLLSASDTFFEKRFTANWELINKYYDEQRPVQLHLGHTFNWEWGTLVIANKIRHQFLGVYMPISNKPLNKVFMKMRSRTGAILINARNMTREFLPHRRGLYCLGLVADQSPGMWMNKARWFTFFNQKTAFNMGPAKSAISNNAVVLFAFIHRPKRGYYEAVFSLAEDQPRSTTDIAITKKFVHYLEDVINQYPDMWLWSHRRWKHAWKEEYGLVK